MPEMATFHRRRRQFMDGVATSLSAFAAILVLMPLAAIFGYLLYKGVGSLNWAFFTQIPKPVGESGGGMANAIAGVLNRRLRPGAEHDGLLRRQPAGDGYLPLIPEQVRVPGIAFHRDGLVHTHSRP